MHRRTAVTVALAAISIAAALSGCAPTMPTPDASPDACASSTPTETCVALADALCARVLECCGVQPRPASCPSWASVRECRLELARQNPDLDCATQTGASVCRSRVESCTAQYPRLACADVLAGTAHVDCR